MGIEYCGTHYSGWQTQPGGGTVQDCVEASVSCVASDDTSVQCAGRTDAGVHAVAQVAHFDTRAERSPRQWVLGLNTNLPKDINVAWVRVVDDNFHARFGAVQRRYRYVVLNRLYRSALMHQRVHFEPRTLDHQRMHEAAQQLVGKHDFNAFRSASCQAKHAVRSVSSLRVRRQDDFVTVDIAADAFLQNMVRIIVGSLLRVGRGDADAQWLGQVLAGRDRKHLGATAPPEGLYLTAVEYPDAYALPSAPELDPLLPFVPKRAG